MLVDPENKEEFYHEECSVCGRPVVVGPKVHAAGGPFTHPAQVCALYLADKRADVRERRANMHVVKAAP